MQWLIDRLNSVVDRIWALERELDGNRDDVNSLKSDVAKTKKVTDYQGLAVEDLRKRVEALEARATTLESKYRGKAISAGMQRAARLRAEEKLKRKN